MPPAPLLPVSRARARPRDARRAALCLALAAASLSGPPSASAALEPAGPTTAHAAVATPSARTGAAPPATVTLPAPTARAQRESADASGPSAGDWIVGIRGARAHAARLARSFGGSFDPALGAAIVPRDHARAFVDGLGEGAVAWAEPDVAATRTASFDRPAPAGGVSPWARTLAATPSLTPVRTSLAPIGVVDDAVDASVAELQGTDVVNALGAIEPHGTMVASVAAAPFDGMGVVGVAPGARVLSWGTTLTCADVSRGIFTLVRLGARIVNLSLGFNQACYALWRATSYAYAKGVVMVVASGNDGDRGNPLSYPASYPHVVTAAAVDQALTVPAFSNHNEYVDIAAPGVDIPVDTPLRFDIEDGVLDGLSEVSGTSFASPFVAGGVSWILGARPELDPGQVSRILQGSSVDVGAAGWDRFSGFGLLNVTRALGHPAPTPDPLEPNDDPGFTKKAGKGPFSKRTIWSGGRRDARLVGFGDSADDPIDAYRVRIPGRSRVRVAVKARAGLTDLFVFDGAARNFSGTPVDASTRKGRTIDTVTVRNTGRTSRDAFVVVNTVDGGTRAASKYVLTVARRG